MTAKSVVGDPTDEPMKKRSECVAMVGSVVLTREQYQGNPRAS
jgi:hypothetical protein